MDKDYDRKSASINAVMLDAYGGRHAIVIDQIGDKSLHMANTDCRPAIGDRIDLEFVRHEKSGVGVVLMRVIVADVDRTGIGARLMYKSESLFVDSGRRQTTGPAVRKTGGIG